MIPIDSRRPGLAKTRGERVVRVRVVTVVRSSNGELRAMFDAADVMSEGSVRPRQTATGAPVWYGSTSLILPWPPGLGGSQAPAPARAFLAAVAARDPHVRLRAVRIAHREASLRAPGVLGRAECELRVADGDGGLRIDVDVQAPLTLSPHRSHLGASGDGASLPIP